MAGGALIDVLKGRRPSRRPIWFMRQAGRYLPEYRAVREKAGSFLDLCYNSELAAEVTLQPLERFDLDAAIVFSDILVLPHAMGVDVRFEVGEGPVLKPVRDAQQVSGLRPAKGSREVEAIYGTLREVKGRLSDGKALIGFCGGAWTVASYMVEGGASDRSRSRLAAYEGLPWFDALIDRLVDESADYLGGQIDAGAEVVQIFDSWAGELPPRLRQRYVFEPMRKIVEQVKRNHPGFPVIAFARGVGSDHGRIGELDGVDCVGVETERDLNSALADVGECCAVQGNLDPLALLAGDDVLRREVAAVTAAVPMARHVFNLGHGIRQETDPRKLEVVVDMVRQLDGTR